MIMKNYILKWLMGNKGEVRGLAVLRGLDSLYRDFLFLGEKI